MTRIMLKNWSLVFGICAISLFVEAGQTHVHTGDSIGEPGQALQISRTITIDMQDRMRFVPATLNVKEGETIRLLIRNTGSLTHELVLGNAKDLQAHSEVMKRAPQMRHADPGALSLAPGTKGELVWRFTRPMTIDFACLQPGHFAAGMQGKIEVSRVKAGQTDAHTH